MWRCSEGLRADLRLSGERRIFDMILAAAQNSWIDGDKAMMESLIAFKRVGADGVFTCYWSSLRGRRGRAGSAPRGCASGRTGVRATRKSPPRMSIDAADPKRELSQSVEWSGLTLVRKHKTRATRDRRFDR